MLILAGIAGGLVFGLAVLFLTIPPSQPAAPAHSARLKDLESAVRRRQKVGRERRRGLSFSEPGPRNDEPVGSAHD